jgi:hypothetical protein
VDIQIIHQSEEVVGLIQNYERTGIMEDLNKAFDMMEQVIDMTPQGSVYRANRLTNFGVILGKRFERTGSMDDLNRAVDVADMAVNATPEDHPDRAGYLNNFGSWLSTRFEQTGLMDDLHRAVDVADMAVNATPQGHPDRAAILNNLGNSLGMRFRRTGSMDDLHRAVDVSNIAVNATAQDHPNRAGYLNNLGNRLGTRFERTGSMDDLHRAVDVADMAVNATPQGHPNRAMYLNNLGNSLGTRFERTGSMDDLHRAVDVSKMAVNATAQDHPNRAMYLNNLGNWLGTRFRRTGLMDDLHRAVDVADMAVNATAQDHPNRAMYLNSLGNRLSTRFERTGSMDDLHRAVDVSNIAVNATAQDYPNRAMYLNNLGNRLGTRFKRTGLMDDLHRAVNVADMAVNATAEDYPDRAMYLNSLGNWLGTRFERTGSMDDLHRAVDVADMAVNATAQDHPNRAGYLNNLGNRLGRRFGRTGSMDDLHRAVDVADMAVNATAQDHPDRAMYLNNLGNRLGTRFERTGSMDDLHRAVDVADIAVNATAQDHPNRAGWLKNLGNRLSTRFERTGSMDDLNRALSHYKAGWSCHSSPPSIRIRSARRAADILASQRNWEESSEILQGAVQLLPLVSPRLLNNNDKQHILGEFAGLASMAAAISLMAGKDEHCALELLELGRCVIAGLLLEMRTDISLLKEQHPGLAAEFESLRDQLDSTPSKAAPLGDGAPSWELQVNRRFEADQKFSEVITKIREQSGFQNFLLPPTSYELMAAADQGTIITINVSSYRCDAFLIERKRITVLPLPDLKAEELKEKAQQLSAGSTRTLEWLWNVAAGPILDALGHQCPPSHLSPPRVWWIPTGTLSHFPIHAAGYHTKGSTKTVLDRVMSSYGSSIKALVYGRRHSVRRATESASEHALLVAMQETPCLQRGSALPFATREVEMLADLCPSLELKAVRPLQRREEVLAHLRACKIFHFAGHGRSDPLDPSRSCLLLEDWKESPLTVGDLRDYKIQESSPFLGYLSACSTSANKVGRLVDEGIHLASAFQLAGFRHVIGTLWEVSDSYCVDVARVVYETIRDEGMTDKAVCRGLHLAIKALRDRDVSMLRATRDGEVVHTNGETTVHISFYWVPYVHFGV